MNQIDIILALPLLWGAIIGFKKGLILELASLVGLILGVYGSITFSNYTAELLNDHISVPAEWIGLLSFLLTFIGIVIAVFLLAKALDKALKIIALGLVNRILGLVFGLCKYAIIVSVLLYFFTNLNNRFQFVETDILEDSMLLGPLETIIQPFSALLDNFEINTIKEEVDQLDLTD